MVVEIGPEVADLQNGRVILSAETFSSYQLSPGQLLAVSNI